MLLAALRNDIFCGKLNCDLFVFWFGRTACAQASLKMSNFAASSKSDVENFWNAASCGELAYAQGADFRTQMKSQADARYLLEPYIHDFAGFQDGHNRDVLEIGVGMGSDHQLWAERKPARLCGVDLTERAIEFTSDRLALCSGLSSELRKADAENLPFPDASFDIVYSWGVLHHTPDTQKAFAEAARVLRPGGIARIMIYHTWSLTGFMLWLRYGPARLKCPSMSQIYSEYLESPGTKAYTVKEAHGLVRRAGFRDVTVRVQLGPGDLLEGGVGQRHQGRLLQIARAVWPRSLFRTLTPSLGLYLLIEARR
jgi:ubiquinone/menaquinone biosynthesis C-methylase UbiE